MITPGELFVGQYVTVHHWLNDNSPENKKHTNESDEKYEDSNPFISLMCDTKPFINDSYKGDVLRIELPYILVHPIPYRFINVHSIDIRQVALMELSKEYVKVLTGSTHENC